MTDQDTRTRLVEEEVPTARLRRSPDDKVFGGVCGGLGEYFGIDPVWFRVAFVAMVFAGAGGGLVLYVIAMIAIPEREEGEPHAASGKYSGKQGTIIVGAVLIIVGGIALLNMAIPWIDTLFWPGVLIALGAALLWGGGARDTR